MMEEKMRKRLVTIGMILGSIALCAVTFFGIRARFVPPTPKSQTTKGKTVSVYIDDGTGTYRPNEDGTFPTTGYVLNTEKSGCANGGVLSQNPETKTISLSVSGSDQCHVYFDKEKCTESTLTIAGKTFTVNEVSANGTYADCANQGEMFAFDHEATGQVSTWTADELRDYRYIGSNPNNYITFNDETWRIIGVFTVEVDKGNDTTEKQQLVKIIRDASIGSLPWNSTKVNSAYTNEWTGGSLQTLLNSGDYYNQTGSYTSTSTNKGLSTTARSQIASVKYYLGGSTTNQNLGGPDYYAFERGTTTYQNSRQTSIKQQVGLMYPSDYAYTYANGVDKTCFEDGYNCRTNQGGTPSNGWLFNSDYQWTQSPSASYAYYASIAYSTGGLRGNYSVYNKYVVRPTVYLASNILILGTGEQGNPYRIKTNS